MNTQRAPMILLAAAISSSLLSAQNWPFIAHDTRPVITRGRYLLATTETSATVVWMTDTPAHSKVLYGAGDTVDLAAEPDEHGLKPIGASHAVELLRPRQARLHTLRNHGHSRRPRAHQARDEPHRLACRRLPRSSRRRLRHRIRRHDLGSLARPSHLGPLPLQALTLRVLYVRGNHETRGASARALLRHVSIPEGRFYYSRDHGPAHFIVLDTGEDKPDETNVYARLKAFRAYREGDYAWLGDHVRTSAALKQEPFRILLMHAPNWGWTDNQSSMWTELANQSRVDLSISGHTHRFSCTPPRQGENKWHQLVIAPDQVARVDVSVKKLPVTVIGPGKTTVAAFKVPR